MIGRLISFWDDLFSGAMLATIGDTPIFDFHDYRRKCTFGTL